MPEKRLISEVLANRELAAERNHQQEEEKKSVEEAKKLLPEFSGKLGAVIKPHFPPTSKRDINWRVDIRPEYILGCTIHHDGTEIPVTLKSNIDPNGTIDNRMPIYILDLPDLDYVLEISKHEATVRSKQIQSSAPVDWENAVIGHKYPSWPAWERPANLDDITAYQDLLEVMLQSETDYTARKENVKVEY